MTLQRVVIQFEDPMTSAGLPEPPRFFTSDVALTCPLRVPGEGFRLHGRGKPAWDLPNAPNPEWEAALTAEETAHLLALLAELVVPYSPPRPSGLDGSTHILEIAAGAHAIRLEWWSELPPGWERAGALYDYALSLARRTYLAWLEGR